MTHPPMPRRPTLPLPPHAADPGHLSKPSHVPDFLLCSHPNYTRQHSADVCRLILVALIRGLDVLTAASASSALELHEKSTNMKWWFNKTEIKENVSCRDVMDSICFRKGNIMISVFLCFVNNKCFKIIIINASLSQKNKIKMLPRGYSVTQADQLYCLLIDCLFACWDEFTLIMFMNVPLRASVTKVHTKGDV